MMSMANGDNYLKLEPKGGIYVREAGKLREEMLAAFDKGQYYFDLDLSAVTHIDSAGLGVLIQIHKRVEPKGGEVVIRGLSGAVKELFYLTRMDRTFRIE